MKSIPFESAVSFASVLSLAVTLVACGKPGLKSEVRPADAKASPSPVAAGPAPMADADVSAAKAPVASPSPAAPSVSVIATPKADVPRKGDFGYGSWIEVRNCQPDASTSPEAGAACLGYLGQISQGKAVATCTDDDRQQRKGGGVCHEQGSLCRSGSDGQGYRLWACHVHSYQPSALKGGWTEVRNCQSDGARGPEADAACLAYLDTLGTASRCTDAERVSGTGGASCDREGKLCRSGADGKGARVWSCHLPKVKVEGVSVPSFQAVGSWLEIRNCQADFNLGAQPYAACLAYLDTLGKDAARCTDTERQTASGGGACTRSGAMCRSGADGKGARLLVCQ